MKLTFHIISQPNAVGHLEHWKMGIRTLWVVCLRVVVTNLFRIRTVSPRSAGLYKCYLVDCPVQFFAMLNGTLNK